MVNDPNASCPISAEQSEEIRRLTHDLSNALEIILQTSYLLSTLELDVNGRQWLKMLDSGVQQSVAVTRELREYIRIHS